MGRKSHSWTEEAGVGVGQGSTTQRRGYTVSRGSKPLKGADANTQDSLWPRSGWVAGSVVKLGLLERE